MDGGGPIRCILLTMRVDCHRVHTQNRGLALANLPARAAVRSIAPLTAALPTPARGFSVGAPARDELERTEAVTSELQYVTHKFLSPARAISLTALLVRRHYGQWLADILPSMIDAVVVAKGELCIVVTPPAIAHVMTFLRDHSNCQVRAPVRFLRAGRAGRMLTPPPPPFAQRNSTRWYPMSPRWIIQNGRSGLRLCITC